MQASSSLLASTLGADPIARWGERVSRAAAGLVAFVAVGSVAAANGGYDPPSWGIAAALLLTVAAVAVAARPAVVLSRPELATLAAFASLTGWMLVSALWSNDAAASILSGERCLVYVAGLAAVLVLARPGRVGGLLAGALAAATLTVVNGLVGLILPSTFAIGGQAQTGRLAAPIGYWNGLAVVAAIGMLVAFGLAARCSTAAGRIAALAPLPVLAVGLYLTYSRGGWLAMCIGLVVMLALETRRWQLALVVGACAPWLALDVVVTARSAALTHVASPIGPATSQGHRLGLAIVATIPAIVLAALATLAVERRWSPSPRLGRLVRAFVVVLALTAVAVPVLEYGSPAALGRHVYGAFNAAAPGGFRATHGHAGRSLNDRLFSLSGNGRIQLWKAAWNDYRAHPQLGSGAGTYERWWLAHRPGSLKVRNAHSLYLETLAELGPLGLVLLVIGIGTPLAVAARRRHVPLVPVAAAAFAAYSVHAAVDWDFQLPGVTLLGLVCAAAVLVGGRRADLPRVRPAARWAVAVAAGVVIVAALGGLRGNLALARSTNAAASGNWPAAIAEARVAQRWQPWSDAPWVALGEAELGEGRFTAAAAAFHKGASIAPGDWSAWFGLARATTGRDRRLALARALELDPREPVVTLLARAAGMGSPPS
jgi:O-Antigen ligase